MAQSSSPRPEKSRLARQLSLPTEIHLRRLPVRDALDRMERYLNDAAVAGMPWVRIIHGKGTGTLKGAVLEFLSGHPLVVSHHPASPSEGGGGGDHRPIAVGGMLDAANAPGERC